MTIYDFDTMEGQDKLVVLSSEAVLLGLRKDGCFAIGLFQLDNFYVEIYFHTTQGCIKNIRCFSDTADLAPYLDQVNISELLQEIF
jgi:hypothetical protein